MTHTPSQEALDAGIESTEQLGEEHLIKYFDDLLVGYEELNKAAVVDIIDKGISAESQNKAYEYVYTYGALLNMYQDLKVELEKKSERLKHDMYRENIFEQKDSKIDGITKTYNKNLTTILRELRKHKNKIVNLEQENSSRVNNGEIKINYFDISQLDQRELESKYIKGLKLVQADIKKFMSIEFFGSLIDKLNNISKLKVTNTGSIHDSNVINEIGEDFFELITVFGELREQFLDGKIEDKELSSKYEELRKNYEILKKDHTRITDENNAYIKTKKNQEKFNISPTTKVQHVKLQSDYDQLETKYKQQSTEYQKIDLDNEKLDNENRELRNKVTELATILGLGPSRIEGIINFIKKEKQFKKVVHKGSEIIGKTVGIISEDKSYLAQQVESEKEKNKQHVREKNTLQRKLKKAEENEVAMQKKIDEMQKLISDRNIEKTKDGYNPVSVSA